MQYSHVNKRSSIDNNRTALCTDRQKTKNKNQEIAAIFRTLDKIECTKFIIIY